MPYYCNIEINNKTRSKIDLSLVRKTTERFLKLYEKQNSEISIAFIGDKTIRKLNKTYRGINKITDVLAFPYIAAGTGTDDEQSNFLGEVIIDYTQVKKQSRKYSNSVKQELIFILVHGLLHLLGYDDKTEKGRREMERLGKEFVKIFKL